MVLNTDVYLVILDHIDSIPDILAFMYSCKKHCALAAPRLLHFGAHIRSDAHLVSFCRFMLRDITSRTPYLHRLFLCIDLQIIDDDASRSDRARDPEGTQQEALRGAALLRQVMHCASELEHLTIHFCEELLQREASLIEAIIALRTVKYLHITSSGTRAFKVLADIRSPLVEVEVDCRYNEEVRITQILARHGKTLEKLTAWHFNLSAKPLEHPALVFPRVDTLIVRSCLALDTPPLVRTFPNIRLLEVSDGGYPKLHHYSHARRPGDSNRVTSPAWPNLAHLCVDENALRMLDLRRPVRRVDLVWDHNYGNRHRLLADVRDLRPTHMLLLCPFFETQEDSVPWELPDIGLLQGTSVTHLAVDICPATWGEWGTTKYGFSDIICDAPVTFFSLRVRLPLLEDESPFGANDPRHPQGPSLPDAVRRVTERDLCGANQSMFIRGAPLVFLLAFFVPSLQYVRLEILDDAPLCVEICRLQENELELVPLEVEQWKALVRAEGMEWRLRASEPPRFNEDNLVDRTAHSQDDE